MLTRQDADYYNSVGAWRGLKFFWDWERGLIMDAREKTLTTQTTGQIRDRFGYKRGSGRDRGRRRRQHSRRRVEIEIEIYSKGGVAAAAAREQVFCSTLRFQSLVRTCLSVNWKMVRTPKFVGQLVFSTTLKNCPSCQFVTYKSRSSQNRLHDMRLSNIHTRPSHTCVDIGNNHSNDPCALNIVLLTAVLGYHFQVL